MKNSHLLFIFFIISSMLNAQRVNPLETLNPASSELVTCVGTPTPGDLVINGNFEQYSALPDNLSQITLACEWSSPNIGTPDYFHRNGSVLVDIPDNFAGSQEVNSVHGGDAYTGIAYNSSSREIIITQLLEPLEPNTEYTLTFNVSATNHGLTSFIKFQAYLGPYIQISTVGEPPLDPNGILLENDSFTTNIIGWDTITFNFTTGANAGQEYLYIGTISNAQISNGLGYSYIDNVSLKPTPVEDCGICTDTVGNFPVVSNPYNLTNNFLAKATASDCNGNIYSLGDINGTLILNKYDLNGTLQWSQNTTIVHPFTSVKSIAMEVDENENIYIKHHDDLYKYDSNGILSWQLQLINDLFDIEKTGTFAINKQTEDLYIPLNNSTVLYNPNNPGTFLNYILNIGVESTVLKIDSNGNATDLGAFSSNGILNLHYNNGLYVWYQNSLDIGFREYELDVLSADNTTWLDNTVVSSYDNLYPLYYNHVNNEVYVFTGNEATTSNNNTRILCVSHDGNTINANILLPEALHYSGTLLRENCSFNQSNGELAIYADNYQSNGSSVVSTIDINYQLENKSLISTSSFSNPFYSNSYHSITYGGSCLYFYGHYESTSNIILDGGAVLPPSGANNLRSFIIRLQDDLEIESNFSESISANTDIIVTKNPTNGDVIKIKFKEGYQDIIKFILHDKHGRFILQEDGFLNEMGEYNLKLIHEKNDLLFLKIVLSSGYSETKRVIVSH